MTREPTGPGAPGPTSPGEEERADPAQAATPVDGRDDRAAGPPFVIGITGPIGCGKSTVARMLAALGGSVIDADDLARQVTAPGQPALSAIRARFGESVFQGSGALDRSALAALVFADADALRDLEAIVHPHVRTLVEAALGRAAGENAPFVAIEAIKLVEGGLADRCHEVWVVACDAPEQRARLHARGLEGPDIELRLAAQGAALADRLEERIAGRPHRRIVTSGPLETLRERVEDALAEALAPLFPGLPVGPVERASGGR